MGIKATYIQDASGQKYYPYAHADASFCADGETVGKKLKDLEERGGLKVFTTTLIGDGMTKTFNINHKLNKTDILFQISDEKGQCLLDFSIVDSDNISVNFEIAPTSTEIYKIMII